MSEHVMQKKGKSKSYAMDLTTGSVWTKMLLFALPLMCSSMLQLLFNAADIVVVGRFVGDNSLAAVGSNTALINLLTNLFIGLSVGVNVLCARYYGAKKEQGLSDTVHTAIFVSIISGLFLNLFGVVFARRILILMSTPAEVLDLATLYLRIYFFGMTGMMVYNFGSAVLRALGDTKRPLYYLFFSGIVNVILNLLFVLVFQMDVAGVALATVASQCISAALVIRCLIREKGAVHLNLKKIHMHKTIFVRIMQIGIPAGIQGIVFALSNVVIQSSVNSFGAVIMAGNSAAANIEGFVYMAMNAFYQSALTFVGQNMGAGQKKRVIRILFTAQALVILTGLLLGNGAHLFGRSLLRIYSSSPAVIDAGMQRLRVICVTYALCGMMDVMVGVLRGLGYAVLPMIVSLIGACGLRLLLIFTIFRLPEFHTMFVLYLSYPITWIITFFVHVICFLIIARKEHIL